MKKLLLPFAIFSLLISSCNSDDDSNNSTDDSSIIGTWITTSIIEDNEDVATICDRQEFYQINEDNTFSFQLFDEIEDVNQDGTVTVTGCSESELLTGSYTIENNNITFEFAPDDTEEAMFSLEENKLTLSFDGDIETYAKQ